MLAELKPLFVIRIGIAFVFLWFGISKVLNPSEWVVWLPQWTEQFPLSSTTKLVVEGLLELVLGVMLLLGLFTRLAASVTAALLLVIILVIGYNDTAIRDVGILFMAIALIINKDNPLSLDNLRKKQ